MSNLLVALVASAATMLGAYLVVKGQMVRKHMKRRRDRHELIYIPTMEPQRGDGT